MTPPIAKRAAHLNKSLIRQIADAAAKGTINLGLGQPAIDPHPSVMERLAKAAKDNKAAYTPNAGDTELRARIAAELYDNSPMESVLITIGSEEAMYTILTAITDPGDEIMGPEPGYPAYKTISGLIGAVHTPYKLTEDFRIDVDATLAAITPKTRVLITTSPSNPTGRFAGSNADMKRLVEGCAAKNVWVIDDCLYRDIAFVEHHQPLFKFGDNVITIDAISKSYACTGLRVGWLHAPVELELKLIAIHQAVCTTAPTPSQEATKACLDLRKTNYLKEICALYAERANAAESALAKEPRIKFHKSEGAFYVFADVRDFGVDTKELAFDLARAGKVSVVPGVAFGPSANGFVRVTFAPKPDQIALGIERLIEGLRSAKKAA